jgi:hypothetical protein
MSNQVKIADRCGCIGIASGMVTFVSAAVTVIALDKGNEEVAKRAYNINQAAGLTTAFFTGLSLGLRTTIE